MNPYGDLDQATAACTNFYIPQDAYLANVSLRYFATGVTQLSLTSSTGTRGAYGKPVTGDELLSTDYSNNSRLLYSFIGRVDDNPESSKQGTVTGLGLISYDARCLSSEKVRLSGEWTWGVYEVDEDTDEQVASEETTEVRTVEPVEPRR